MSKIRLIPYAAMTAAGLLAASGAANAQSMYDINQRQDYQQDRIERGIYSGQISRNEAGSLERGERRIDFAQHQAEADGRVTGQERARIDRMTDRQGQAINQQRHDREQAWDRSQGWGRTDGRPYNGWNDRDGWGGTGNGQSMYGVNQRQNYQQDRIERGIYSGQISRNEAGRLEQGERRIDFAQARAEADGRVTGQERARIDRMTDRQGREINQQRNDREQAWDRGQNWGRTDGRAHNGWNDLEGRGRGGDNRGREADGRDWGRDHNNGGWNQGRDNNGWNQNGNGGWNRGDNTASSGGSNHNGNGGWNHSGNGSGTGTGTGTGTGHTWNRGGSTGTGTGTGTGTTGGTHSWGGGGWNHGGSRGTGTGTGTTTPPTTGGTAVASNGGMRSWGGQMRPASATTMAAPTRSYATANTGARSAGGGRSFGGGGQGHR